MTTPRMTAEQRARWLLECRGFTVREALKNHGDDGCELWVETIASAIRSAEVEAANEALEEAAHKFDLDRESAERRGWSSRAHRYRITAEQIRYLKRTTEGK